MAAQRFLLELEFVQCLSNPTYIHYLAQNRYFEDEAFIGYLKYLQYWQRPEYIKFIMYPHCLYFLELLQNASFRNAMAHPGNKELAHRQQFYFWKNYRNNHLKHILPRSLPEPVAALQASAPPPPPPPMPPTTMSVSAAPADLPAPAPPPALSPMQYANPLGSALTKNDPRNRKIKPIAAQPFCRCIRDNTLRSSHWERNQISFKSVQVATLRMQKPCLLASSFWLKNYIFLGSNKMFGICLNY